MDELIIKINKDSNGNDVSLENMSLDLVNTLKDMLSSLSNFANTTDSDIRMSLVNGSAALTLKEIPTETSNIIKGVFDGTERDFGKIRYLKEVQKSLFNYNSQDFSFILKKQGTQFDYTDSIKRKVVSFKRNTKQKTSQIVFVEGILFDCGGKKPNIHINYNQELEYKISCTEFDAKKVVNKLYGKVYLSALKTIERGNSKPYYDFIDSYLSPETRDIYKKMYDVFMQKTKIDKYGYLFDIVQEIILNPSKNNTEINKIIKLFNNSTSDKGTLNTILVAAKPVANDIDTEYKKLLVEFNKR